MRGAHHDGAGLLQLHEREADLGAALHRRGPLLEHLRCDRARGCVGDPAHACRTSRPMQWKRHLIVNVLRVVRAEAEVTCMLLTCLEWV